MIGFHGKHSLVPGTKKICAKESIVLCTERMKTTKLVHI